ncbi:MAG: HAD family hydrolase, partial [Candidatus Dormiibacterota bacterium]
MSPLGLPGQVSACLFDLDGVLTQTAKIHAAAWKEMFDAYLRGRATDRGEKFVPFDEVADYDKFVDGKPRYDGVRSFLASREIELPAGDPTDAPQVETVDGLGNRKNELVLKLIQEHGVQPYAGSVRYVQAVHKAG